MQALERLKIGFGNLASGHSSDESAIQAAQPEGLQTEGAQQVAMNSGLEVHIWVDRARTNAGIEPAPLCFPCSIGCFGHHLAQAHVQAWVCPQVSSERSQAGVLK